MRRDHKPKLLCPYHMDPGAAAPPAPTTTTTTAPTVTPHTDYWITDGLYGSFNCILYDGQNPTFKV